MKELRVTSYELQVAALLCRKGTRSSSTQYSSRACVIVSIMIEYIRGGLAELSPATAVIDCNGLGYAVNISLNTYAAIQGKKECKLYIYEAIREDAYILYGFADKQERE